MLVLVTGAMAAGTGSCASAWEAQSVRQKLSSCRGIFIAERRSTGTEFQDRRTLMLLEKTLGLRYRSQNGCRQGEKQSGHGLNWGTRKDLMRPVCAKATAGPDSLWLTVSF